MRNTTDAEYKEFFDWLDRAMGDITTPAIGDIPALTFKASDIMAFANVGHKTANLCDELFDEYFVVKYYNGFMHSLGRDNSVSATNVLPRGRKPHWKRLRRNYGYL